MGKLERHALASRNLEHSGDGIASRQRDGTSQNQHVRTQDGDEGVVIETPLPRYCDSVVEACRELADKRDTAGTSLDESNEVRTAIRVKGHEINCDRTPVRRLKLRFEDEVLSRYRRFTNAFPLGAMRQRPWLRSPRSAAKHAPESTCGQHSQSIEPSLPTSAAVSRSPINA